MRHRNAGRKLGRTSAHRSALLRNMVTSLLEHEQIQTTDAKAKELRRVAERMITLGKRGDLHARRLAARVVRSREATGRLFGPLAERYRERAGGYTRILKLRTRVGDAAPISIIELVDREVAEPKQPTGDKPDKAKAKRATRQPKAEKPEKAKKLDKKAGAAKGAPTKGRKKAV
jgi:large subunit ribosomal protein L17